MLSKVVELAPMASEYGTSGVRTWIEDNIITVMVLVIGAVILWAAKSGNASKVVSIFGLAIVGLAFLGLASGTNAQDVGTFVVGLFKQG